jgi:hypothetical protein
MDRSGSIGVGPFALAARCRNCMSGLLSIVLWLGLVLIGIGSMQWGAARAADLLDILRGHWALPATAGVTHETLNPDPGGLWRKANLCDHRTGPDN